jgi:hypothetical protein
MTNLKRTKYQYFNDRNGDVHDIYLLFWCGANKVLATEHRPAEGAFSTLE